LIGRGNHARRRRKRNSQFNCPYVYTHIYIRLMCVCEPCVLDKHSFTHTHTHTHLQAYGFEWKKIIYNEPLIRSGKTNMFIVEHVFSIYYVFRISHIRAAKRKHSSNRVYKICILHTAQCRNYNNSEAPVQQY